MRSKEAAGSGTVILDGQEIPYAVVYSSRRKSWAIEVKPNATVIVHMPQQIPSEKVKKLVDAKADWIFTQVQKYTARTTISRGYTNGETLPFFGTEYPVIRKSGNSTRAEFTNGQFIITVPDTFTEGEQTKLARVMMIMLYRRIGTAPLEEIISRYAPLAGVAPPKLRIQQQEWKWGCCTPKNGIIINASVFFGPKIVIEYIVVHELSHLRFRHHQKTFWAEVGRLMPNYCDAEAILKTDGWKFVF
ncbi:MAG: M48 family metallopeptidase [Methanocalculaceae archaeon]|jgi:predicted metal-dependent hydrolase|nr:M48 family metallopeptidase [Methanocalculaceae archaeon]